MSMYSTPVKMDGTENGDSTPEQKAPVVIAAPTSREELELLILKYRSDHSTQTNIAEQKETEKVLYKISKQEEEYKIKLAKLRKVSQKRKRSYDPKVMASQIAALQLLSKNLDLPEELEESFKERDDTSPATSDDVVKPVKVSTDFKEYFKNLGLTDEFAQNYEANLNKMTTTEQVVANKVLSRIAELERLPSNVGTFKVGEVDLLPADELVKDADELKIKALVELKSLRLLAKQKSLRKNLLFATGNEAHNKVDYLKDFPLVVSAKRSLLIRPKVVQKGTARLAEELEKQQFLEKQRLEKAKRMEVINQLVETSNEIINYKQELREKSYEVGRSVLHLHSQIEKEESKKFERTAKQRLAALKSNDEEAYLKLLDKTKDTRITHLLKQTNAFLDSLSQAVRAQQDAAKAANGEAPTEITDEEREKIDYYEVAHRVKEEITKQPSILVGGTLKEYQLKGLQWMVSLYNNHLNGILADEMGLGKTIQSISLITYLYEVKKQTGPFLVIVPLSTITNWTIEFEKWAPALKTIVYKGTPTQRKELSYDIRSGNFTVLLTTFEYIIKDRPLLCKHKWAHMIIDEGHRMKNAQSKLSATLTQYYHTRNRLILTGTPLQNNLPELWALLNFVLPKVFNSVKSFDEWFNTPFANTGGEKMELSEEETLLVIRRLHKVLRPFLLRRLKREVEKDLPDKVEKVIKCKLSGLQNVLYQQMLNHNALFIGAGAQGATKSGIKGLNNKIMQLRKICNHPYVFEEVEDIINPTRASTNMLWRSSGKFELLDRILPKFKKSGHRVLMFFQMTQVMDIMEDYLRMQDMKYLRLDGSTKADDRTGMLKIFNDPESEYFCFLLSTRAGGLGLNLQTADTVIIFDTDWNPHQDLQAQDRAHRIGQKNEVRILRLITTDTVEEVILDRALQKLDIDGKVIQAGKFDNKSTSEEQEAYLRRLIESEGNREDDEKEELDDTELNEILARSEDEKVLFAEIDKERKQQDKLNGTTERLLTKDELPAVFTEDISKHLEVETKELGRTREKKRVYYDDGLTEEQWLEAVDKDKDSLDAAIARKRAARERRAQRLSDAGRPPPKRTRVAQYRESESEEEEEEEEVDYDDDSASEEYEAEAAAAGRVEEEPQAKGTNTNGKPGSFQDSAFRVLDAMTKYEAPDGHLLCEYFIELPSKKLYPDYYQVIAQPTSVNTIKNLVKKGKINNLELLREAIERIYSNAKFYNEEGSPVWQDAVELEKLTNLKIAEVFKTR